MSGKVRGFVVCFILNEQCKFMNRTDAVVKAKDALKMLN